MRSSRSWRSQRYVMSGPMPSAIAVAAPAATHGIEWQYRGSPSLDQEQRGEAEEDEEAAGVRDGGDHDRRADRRIAAELDHRHRNQHAHHRGKRQVERHRAHHYRAERDVLVEQHRDQTHDAAPDDAVQQRDLKLLADELARMLARHLPERYRTHDHRDRLVARIAADARD